MMWVALPASATVGAVTVKHCLAVEASDRTTYWSRHRSMYWAARYVAVSAIAMPAIPCATPARMTVPRTPVPSVSVAPAAKPARTVEPWASADEDAAREPVWTVIAVRSTSVWSVPVVSVSTDRRCANRYADRTDSDSNADLSLRIR